MYQTPAPLLWTFDTQRNNKRNLVRGAVFRRAAAVKTLLKTIHSDLNISTMWLLIFLVWLIIWAGGTYWYLFGKPSPFSLESVRPPGPREFDQKKRDKVIKQGKITDVENC